MYIEDIFSHNFCFIAFLCGINGYATFIDETTAREITSWQLSTLGCFEYFDGALPTYDSTVKKPKRHAALLNGNCSDHMTGLAAATFGLFAKSTEYLYSSVI